MPLPPLALTSLTHSVSTLAVAFCHLAYSCGDSVSNTPPAAAASFFAGSVVPSKVLPISADHASPLFSSMIHISRLDLNVLQTFHAVHATGNITRAAERLGVSQPAVGHALREEDGYEPAGSTRTFRLHMSDVGETIFLPTLGTGGCARPSSRCSARDARRSTGRGR